MIKKAHFLPVLFVLLYLSCCKDVSAQYLAPRISIHMADPAGLVSKIGLKFQYRLSMKHSVLVGYKNYWGFFPGYQGTLEYHHYYRSGESREAFYYGKAGVGNSDYSPKPWFSGWETPYKAPGSYMFIGAGLGKRYNMGHFFIEANVGLKVAQTVEKTEGYNRNLFYSTGPASFIDCGLNLGLQFFDEERNMYNRTLSARRPRNYR